MRRFIFVLLLSALTFSTKAGNFYSASTGNLNNTANWWSNSDGATGTHPSNFTTSNQVFIIINNTAPTITAGWTVSGTGSKIIVGDGIAAINFTIPSTASVTGTIDVAANAILTITNTVSPTLGALNASSTVNYNLSTGGQTIASATYGNLIIGNSSNTNTASGTLTVNGALTTTSGGTLAMSTFQLAGNPASVTNNGTITTVTTVNPAIPSGENWSGTTGLVTFAATTGGQFIPAGTYKSLTCSNTSATNTAVGTLTVNSALTTTSGGTLAMTSFQLLGTLTTVTNNGTITTTCTTDPAIPSSKSWSGTTGLVNFAATTGGQFIPAGTYKGLTVSNTTGTTTATGVLTVNGALTTTSGGIVDLGAYQLLGTLTSVVNNGTITTASTANPAIPSSKSWSGTTGLVNFAATTGGQFIPAATYGALTLSNSSNTNTATGTLRVNGVLTTTSGGTLAMTTFQLLGTLTSVANNGTITTASTSNPAIPTGKNWTGTTGLVNFAAATGGQSIPAGTYGALTVSNTSGTNTAVGTLTINGELTTTSGGTLALSTFQMLGALTSVVHNGTITTANLTSPAIPAGKDWSGTGGASLVTFTATTGAQFIPAGTYKDLTLNNTSGTNTATGILTVNGALTTTSGGTFALSTFQLLGALTTVTNNGTITTSSIDNPAIPADKNWSGTTGLVTFAATAGSQFIPGGTYKTLTLSNTSGTNTAVGALTVNNALTTTSGGTLAMSSFQLLGTITTLTNNGTITTACTTDPAIPTGRSWSGTTGLVNFAATTGGQFIPAGTYKGLTVSNTTGTTTASGILTVNGVLTTTSGGIVDLSAYQLLGTLTSVVNNGTISTASTANPAIPTGKSWSGTTGLVNFAATTGGQFMPSGTYKGLTVSNTTGTTTATGILTVNGALATTSGGIADLSGFQLLGTITSVTNNGTLSTSATANPAIPSGKNWAGTGLVNFAATTGGQFIPSGTFGALTLSNSSNTNTATGTLTVNGTLTTTSGGTLAMTTFQLLGTLPSVTNDGTITTTNTTNPAIPGGKNWTGTTGLVNFAATTGGQSIPAGTYGALTLSNTSNTNTAVGAITVNGDLTTTSGGTLAMSTFQLAGNPASVTNNGTVTTSTTVNPAIPSGENWSGTTGQVTFTATSGAQFIPAGTYKNLTLNNTSGTNTAVGILTVNDALTTTSGGTLALSTFQLLGDLTAVTNNGTITTLSTDNPAIPADKNWSGTTGLVNFAATTGGQFIPAGTYKTLTCSNTSATNTAMGALTVNSALTTTSGGSLAMTSFQLLGTLTTVTNNGTITTTCTTDPAIPTGKSWSGTTGLVNFAATTGGQLIPAGTYKGLTVSNTTGTTTAAGTLTVNGVLTTTSGGIVDLGAYQLLGTITSVANNGTLSTSATANPAIPSGKNWAGTGLVNFAATTGGQFIPAGTYGALTLSNSSNTNTATGALRVNGALTTTSGGTLAMTSFQLLGTLPSVTNDGTITTTTTVSPAIPSGKNWTGTTGLVNFAAATGGQFIPAGTYGALTISNTSGTNTAVGILTINDELITTSGGTLAMSTFQMLGALTSVVHNGTITTANLTNPPIPANKDWSGTGGTSLVTFAATTGGQFIPAGTYKGFTLMNSSGTNTVVGTFAVNGPLTTTSGGVLSMTTFPLLGNPSSVTHNGTITTTSTVNPAIPSGEDWSGTGGTSLVTFATLTGGQSIPAGTFKSLTLSNTSAANTAMGDITVNGVLTTTKNGTLIMGDNQLAGTPTTVTNNGSVYTTCTANPAIPAGKSWSGSTGVVTFAAAAGNQYIPAGTYKYLVCTNTSDTNTAVGDLNVTGTFTTSATGGTMDMGTNTLIAGAVTNTGTILTQNTSSAPLPAGRSWAGRVNYNGTGDQTMVTGTFTNLTLSGARAASPVITLASGTISLSGSFTVAYTGTPSFINTGNTFIYSGNSVQTVGAIPYNNLSCTNTSSTKTAGGDIEVNGALTTTSGGTFALSSYQLSGALTTVTNNGSISTTCTANPAIPSGKSWIGTTGLVTFAAATGNQYIPAGTYKTLTCSNTSGTNTATDNLNVTGTITTSASGGTLDMGTNTLTAAAVTNTGTILTQNTSSAPLPSGLSWAGRVNYNGTGDQTMVTGTFTNLTLSGARAASPVITLASGTINMSGSFTVAYTGAPSFINTGNTFIYSGTTAQTVGAIPYNNLTCSNTSSTKTAGGNIEVSGALTTTSGGTFALSSYQLSGALTTVTNNGSISTTCTANPAIPSGKSWIGTTGLVTFAAATGNQYIPAGTYKTLTCSNTSGTNTATDNLIVTGTITTSGSGGTLDMGTNTLTAAGVTNTGTILTQNESSAPLPSGLSWAGRVNYNGTGNQTMVTGTFTNLTLSGARASSPAITLASGNISLSGSFTVSYTGEVSFINTGNTFIYTANSTQTVGGITYNNLTCTNTSSSTPKNAGGNIVVNGVLTTTSGGTFAMGNYQLTGSLTTITNNGTISTTCTLNPAIPTGKSWGGTTGLVTFAATGGNQYIPGGTYKTLTCSNTSDTNTVTGGPVTVTGTITTTGTGGKLDMGTNELSAATITGSSTGTVFTQCTSSTPLPSGRSYNGTVSYNAAAGGQTVVQGTYKNLTVANTSDSSEASGNVVVNGTLQMTGGSLKMGIYTLSGTSFGSSGAGTIATANTSATPLPTGTTWAQKIMYNGTTGAQTIVAGAYNAGLINANISNTNVAAANISILGSLTLDSGSVLDDGGFQLSLNGNIAGTGTHIKTTTGKISMTGSGATISGATLGNVTLNNAGGFSLTGDATINGTLTLTSGRLSIGNHNLTMGATATAISGSFSSSKMIVINGTGEVRKMFTANGSYLFPLGDNTPNYSPITLNFTDGAYGDGAYAGVRVTNTKHPDDASLTNYLNRYWSVAVSGIESPVYSVSATYLTADIVGDESGISSAMYTGSLPWTKYNSVDAATNNVSADSISDINADFGGITTTNVSVFILPFSSTICNGGVVSLVATGDGVPPFEYSWSPSTGLSDTTSATVLAAPTTGTVTSTYVYTVTITDAQGTTSTATTTVIVQPLPPDITGDSTVCNGSATTLENGLPGGNWTSNNESVAVITSPEGELSAVAPGTAVITYSTGGGCLKTLQVTVNSIPSVEPITGTSSLCEDAIDYLSSATEGGTWSSGAPAIVTVDAATGLVTGMSGGSSSISYTVTNEWSCSTMVTTNIVINGKPHVQEITGTPSVCFGTTTQLDDSTEGGLWLSLDSTLAAVDANGAVTGTIGVAWDTTVNILYIATNDCGVDTATAAVTVKGLPGVGVIVATNNHQVCLGAQVSYSSTHPGGIWSTSDPAIADIDSVSGLLTGVSAGYADLSYTVTGSNGCKKSRLSGITVNTLPSVPSIYTDGLACTGNTITLTGTTGPASYNWSSNDTTIAAIDSNTGVLVGKSVGTAVITYEYRQVCSNYAQTVITVNPTTTATVTGTPVLCASGGNTTLTGAPSGGTWSSSNVLRATVDGSGLVTGVGIGSATITYVYTNSYGCDSKVNTPVTVNALPTVGSVAGPSGVCPGATGLFTNPTTGGVWSTSDADIATVGSSSGIVTGVAPGTMIVSYTVTGSNGCPKSSKLTVTVNELPSVAAIGAGAGTVCTGNTLMLTDASIGTHVWTSDNVAAATVNASTGLLTGVAAGTATISYKYTNGCSNYATTVVTVNAVTIASVTGTQVVCAGGSTTTLSGAPGSGIWSSSTPTKASVDSTSGIVTGVAAGTATITFKYTNGAGCIYRVYTPVTVNALPSIGGISGAASVCAGSTITLTHATAGGTWSSMIPAVGSVGTAGVVTGVTAGTTRISYTVTGANGCSANATKMITVNALPTVSAIVAGSGMVTAGATLALSNATSGTHLWSSSNTSSATVSSSSGLVTGVAPGTATITYAFTSGCTNYATTVVTVNAGARQAIAAPMVEASHINAAIRVYPNPTSGTFSVKSDGGYFTVYSLEGKTIVKYAVQAGVSVLSIPANLAAGVYMCVFSDDKGNREIIRLEYQP